MIGRDPTLGVLAGLGAGAFWGMVFIAPWLTPQLSAVDLTAGRLLAFAALSAVLLAWPDKARGRSANWPTPTQAVWALGLGLLGFSGYFAALALAVLWAGVQVPALIVGTIPLWVMVLGKPGELRWPALLPGLLCTAAGLALMAADTLAPRSMEGVAPQGTRLAAGLAMAALATASWTAFALLNARWLQAQPGLSAGRWTNWLGLASLPGALLLWLVLGTPWAQLRALPDAAAAVAVAVCVVTGIGSAWVASWLWTVASRHLSPSLCGQLIVSETLFALLYAFVWEGRWPSPAQALAACLFVVGVLASLRAQLRAPLALENPA